MKDNFILFADYYKATHHLMESAGIVKKYAYLEARGGYSSDTLFNGLQPILMDYFEGVRIEQWMIDDADDHYFEVFGTREYFNRAGWQRIIDEFGGKLPIEIKAVAEGSIVPVSNILISVENTVDGMSWLANWAETLLLHVWYPITVGTTSLNYYRIGKKYADMSGCQMSPVFLNDFGYRGTTSQQSAGRAGAAHLICSIGTDTGAGVLHVKKYYGFSGSALGVSVKASEHSVSTCRGEEGEHDIIRNIIETTPENMIISLVIDSYDAYKCAEFITTGEMKDKILSRSGKIVLRPDSGDPACMCHAIADIIWKNVGGTINELGYKVFDPHYGIIYGDGINLESIDKILKTVVEYDKYAASNFVFGSGGALLQKCDRDTHKFAFKCSAKLDETGWSDVYKDPITDSGKRSKRGRLALIKEDGEYKTIRLEELGGRENLLKTIFFNGNIIKKFTFDELRSNAGVL